MTTIYEVPLSATPQTLNVVIGPSTYQLAFKFMNSPRDAGFWIMDISDSVGNAIVCGIPLVTGADLLAQYGYLGIQGQMFVRTDGGSPDDTPTFTNLGSSCHLYVATNP